MQSPPGSAPRSIAFVYNDSKEGAARLADELIQQAEHQGLATRLTKDFPLPAGFLAGVDICCVIGGDGTILGTIQEAAENCVPIMGINMGTLGFIANYTIEEAKACIQSLLEGDFVVSERSLLRCCTHDGKRYLALNDIVIKSISSRLVGLEVLSDGKKVNDYYADGLIIATPTGSTAYNLSAGGPILHPDTQSMLLTPINPHALSIRPIVLDTTTRLHIDLQRHDNNLQVSADGRGIGGAESLPLTVYVEPDYTLRLIQHKDYSHFYVLRSKLNWKGQIPYRLSS